MKPIILTTAGVENSIRGLIQTYCYKTYSEAIANSGGIALIAGDDSDPEALAELADGLYLTGGNDVDPAMYHGAQEFSDDVDSWRDHLEVELIHHFVEKKKPIFAICRGLQLLNIAFGGSLYEDISYRLHLEHPMESSHIVHVKPSSCLYRMFGENFLVNSFHHQSIHRLGDGLEAIALTEDNIVEGIVHKELPILGVQWHPERMTGEDPFTPIGPDMKPLFDEFIRQCIDVREGRKTSC